MGGVLLLALALVSRRWDEFTHTFSAYGGVGAAIGIGLSLSLAKSCTKWGMRWRHGTLAAGFRPWVLPSGDDAGALHRHQ
jgi:hypothetical protein